MKLKRSFIFFFLLIFAKELLAGPYVSGLGGFGRFRNTHYPREVHQPVGFAYGLESGFKYDFAALEMLYFKYSACSENSYQSYSYDVCADTSTLGIATRLYFADTVNFIFGYGWHALNLYAERRTPEPAWVAQTRLNSPNSPNLRLYPSDAQAANYFASNGESPTRGLFYGAGGKTSIFLPQLEFQCDVIIFLLGNGGSTESSEIDMIMLGLRYNF